MADAVKTFAEYTNENVYKVNPDGKFEKQQWSCYKDFHPAKYDVSYDAQGWTWVIKNHDEKFALLHGSLSEEEVKRIMASFSGEPTADAPEALVEEKE